MSDIVKNELNQTLFGIVVTGTPEFEKYQQLFDNITTIEHVIPWILGDLCNIGEKLYGEKYSQILDHTYHSLQSLRNCAYVSSKFPLERRRKVVDEHHTPVLLHSHYRAVISLPEPDQEKLLDKAIEYYKENGERVKIKEFMKWVKVFKGINVDDQDKFNKWFEKYWSKPVSEMRKNDKLFTVVDLGNAYERKI